MDPNTLVTAIVTVVTTATGYGTIHWRLSRLEKLVESLALERHENDVRVTRLEDRVDRIEGAAA